jgi:hypothetical protein
MTPRIISELARAIGQQLSKLAVRQQVATCFSTAAGLPSSTAARSPSALTLISRATCSRCRTSVSAFPRRNAGNARNRASRY